MLKRVILFQISSCKNYNDLSYVILRFKLLIAFFMSPRSLISHTSISSPSRLDFSPVEAVSSLRTRTKLVLSM